MSIIPSPKLRVMLCDDSTTVRSALGRLLESDPGIQIVARVGDGAQALAALDTASPLERPFEAQPRDISYARYLAAFAAQDATAYADAVDGFASADIRDELTRIRCPTLLVPAAHDLLLPPALAEEFRRLMPSGLAHIELDAEGAHFLPYQRPASFAARAIRFIESLPGGS